MVVVSHIATVDKNRLVEKIDTLSRVKLEGMIKGCEMVISVRPF